MGVTLLEGLTPADLGFGEPFLEYRKHPVTKQEVQLEAIEFAAYCQKRFAVVCAPTGLGKELVAMSLAKLTGLRTCIITATKGLQEQYGKYHPYGLTTIQGKTNYGCNYYPTKQRPDLVDLDCREGSTMGCEHTRGRGCVYEWHKAKARNEDIVNPNYAYWMAVNDKAKGLERTGAEAEEFGPNPFGLLILDEAHEAPNLVADYLSTKFYEGDVKAYVDPDELGDDVGQWKKFCLKHLPELTAEIETTKMEIDNMGQRAKKMHVDILHRLEQRLEKFERVIGMQEKDWVLEKHIGTRVGRVWAFDVVWPGRYAEHYLFCGIPKIVLMSATVTPKTMAKLGVGRDKYEYRAWPRIFPMNRCPIYYIPAKDESGTSIRVTNKSTESQKRIWVEHMDALIEQRLDRRILIKTSSYKYQDYIMTHSRFAQHMVGNTQDPNSDSAQEMFEKFIQLPVPTILCSPSFGTGWSFENDRAEFCIVSKIELRPPKGASKIMAARLEQDDEWADSETMTSLRQVAGRLQRNEEDRGEIVIVDATWSWFGPKNSHLAGKDFVSSVRTVIKLPSAPPRLYVEPRKKA